MINVINLESPNNELSVEKGTKTELNSRQRLFIYSFVKPLLKQRLDKINIKIDIKSLLQKYKTNTESYCRGNVAFKKCVALKPMRDNHGVNSLKSCSPTQTHSH